MKEEILSSHRIEEIHELMMKHANTNSRHSIQTKIGILYKHPEFWKERKIKGLSTQFFIRFIDYVSFRTPWGLDWKKAILEQYLKPECDDLWRQIEDEIPAANNHGVKKHKDITCNVIKQGNSRDYAIAVLKRDAPDIASQVIRGEISANQGMIKAGKKNPAVTHSATLEGFYQAIQKKLSEPEIAQLKLML